MVILFDMLLCFRPAVNPVQLSDAAVPRRLPLAHLPVLSRTLILTVIGPRAVQATVVGFGCVCVSRCWLCITLPCCCVTSTPCCASVSACRSSMVRRRRRARPADWLSRRALRCHLDGLTSCLGRDRLGARRCGRVANRASGLACSRPFTLLGHARDVDRRSIVANTEAAEHAVARCACSSLSARPTGSMRALSIDGTVPTGAAGQVRYALSCAVDLKATGCVSRRCSGTS